MYGLLAVQTKNMLTKYQDKGCYVSSASILSLICLQSPLLNIKIFFPAPMKLESELSRNIEFPDGKHIYIIMGPSSHTTENCYCFGCNKFHLGILIRWMKSWDLVHLFGNYIINIARVVCLHHRFS